MEYIETPWFNDVPYSFSDIIKKNSLMHKYKEYVLLLCMEVFFIIRRTPKVGGGGGSRKNISLYNLTRINIGSSNKSLYGEAYVIFFFWYKA